MHTSCSGGGFVDAGASVAQEPAERSAGHPARNVSLFPTGIQIGYSQIASGQPPVPRIPRNKKKKIQQHAPHLAYAVLQRAFQIESDEETDGGRRQMANHQNYERVAGHGEL